MKNPGMAGGNLPLRVVSLAREGVKCPDKDPGPGGPGFGGRVEHDHRNNTDESEFHRRLHIDLNFNG